MPGRYYTKTGWLTTFPGYYSVSIKMRKVYTLVFINNRSL